MTSKPELLLLPICIIGPSGCGKSTIVADLVRRELALIVPSWTDRPRRPGEEPLEHVFVSSIEFDRAEADNMFLGVVKPFDLPYRYGLPKLQIELGVPTIVMLRAPFVSTFRSFYPNAPVYQIEASFRFAEKAVWARNDSDEGSRLSGFEKELALGRTVADRILVNDGNDIELLANQIFEWAKNDTA